MNEAMVGEDGAANIKSLTPRPPLHGIGNEASSSGDEIAATVMPLELQLPALRTNARLSGG